MKKLKELPLTTHFKIHLVLLISGLFIGLVSSQFTKDGNAGMVIGFVLMLAGLLWRPVFLRCPHCGGGMPPRGGLPNFCPHCGKKLL